MEITCDQCGRRFSWSGRGRRPLRCSDSCKKAAKRALQKLYPKVGGRVDPQWTRRVRTCRVCGVSWSNIGRHGPREVCSPQCYDAERNGAGNPKAWRSCHRCGEPVPPLSFTFGTKRAGYAWCGCTDRYRPLPLEVRESIWERDGWLCRLCGEPVDRDDRVGNTIGPWYPTLDHIVPRSAGGSDDQSNLRTAHHLCNSVRGPARGEQLAWAV